MRIKGIISLVLLVGLLMPVQAADRIKGSGKLSSKKIEIDDYNAVKIDGVIDFNYVQSDEAPFIEITVDDNLHPYVHIEIKERELTVGFKGIKVDHFTKFIVKTNSKWLKEIKAGGSANFMVNSELTGDELKINASSNSLIQLKRNIKLGELNLNVSGSGNMVINELEVEKLDCNVNGSGTITLKAGEASKAEYSIASNGEIMAFGVEVNDLDCKMTGNGNMQVNAIGTLKSSIIGKGKIRYKGSPSIEKNAVLGKGALEEVN